MTLSNFLQAIIEDPDDDDLRLVYADWLDERGQPKRAEFIRVQIELAKLPKGDERRKNLEARERELILRHEKQWVQPIRAWAREWQFSRGLICGVAVKGSTLLKQAGNIFEFSPIRHLSILDAGKHGRDIAGCPYLARLTSLRLRGFHTADMVHLPESRYLQGITELNLTENGIGNAGLLALAESANLPRLSRLSLVCTQIGDDGVEGLSRSSHLSGLRWLNLDRNRVSDRGAIALAASPHLGELAWLCLGGYWIGEAGLNALRARFGDRVCMDEWRVH